MLKQIQTPTAAKKKGTWPGEVSSQYLAHEETQCSTHTKKIGFLSRDINSLRIFFAYLLVKTRNSLRCIVVINHWLLLLLLLAL